MLVVFLSKARIVALAALALLLAGVSFAEPAASKAATGKQIVLPVKAPVKAKTAAATKKKPALKIAAKLVISAKAKLEKQQKNLLKVASKAIRKAAVATLLKQSRPLVAFAPKGSLRPAFHAAIKPKAKLAVLHFGGKTNVRTALLLPAIKAPLAIVPDVEAELDPNQTEFLPEGPARRFTAAYARFEFADAVSFAPNVTTVCLPSRMKLILNFIAENYGTVTVASGWRDPEHNHAVGGAPRSEHLNCLAIDFLVDGHHQEVVDYLIANTDVGGYKLYRDGHFHIDTGPRRTW